MITIPDDTLSADHLIAKGQYITGLGYQTTLVWEGRRYLFDKLDKNPTLLQGQPLFQTFYNSMLGTNMEQFTRIQDDMAALADASPSQTAGYSSNLASLCANLLQLAAIDSQIYMATGTALSNLQGQRETLLAGMQSLSNANDSLLAIIHSARSALIQQLITDNNALFVATAFEQNEKAVNDVWLKTFAQGILSLTPAQQSTLESIIDQCPQYGSHAVRRARGIYALASFQVYDDDQLCSPGQLLPGSPANAATPTGYTGFRLYPNPAKDLINLVLGEVPDGEVHVHITDVTGKVERDIALAPGQTLYPIELNGLPQGAYFCKLTLSAGQIFVQPFVKSH